MTLNYQPELNIGTCGHVSDGKTTLVKMISGTSPMKYKTEKMRNLTIKLGYANSFLYSCSCENNNKFCYNPNSEFCKDCKQKYIKQKYISFVDCPGHHSLMTTMLNGTSVMDIVLFVIAADKKCPQQQTKEHLKALTIMNLNKVIIVQNKLDLVSRTQAIENFKQIKDFIKDTIIQDAPIIPLSAQLGINLNILCKYLINQPKIIRNISDPFKMVIIRSFNINKPNCDYKTIKGGVIGGTIISGTLKINDKIIIKPGCKINDNYVPLEAKVVSIKSDIYNIEEAIPGGLIALELTIDPFFTQADSLVGNIAEKHNTNEIINSIKLEYHLLKDQKKKIKIKKNDDILLNVFSSNVQSKVLKKYKENNKKFINIGNFNKPININKHENITLLKRINNQNLLIGYGIVLDKNI